MSKDDEPEYPRKWRKMSQEERLAALAAGVRPSKRRTKSSSKKEIVDLLSLVMQNNKPAIDQLLYGWKRYYSAIRRLTIAMVYDKEKKPTITPLSLHKGLLSKEGQKFLPHKDKKPNPKWLKAFIKLLNDSTTIDEIDVWATRILTLRQPRIIKKPPEPGVLMIGVPKQKQPTLIMDIGDDKEAVFSFITDVKFTRELSPTASSASYVNALLGTNYLQEQIHYAGKLNDGRVYQIEVIDCAGGKRCITVEVST